MAEEERNVELAVKCKFCDRIVKMMVRKPDLEEYQRDGRSGRFIQDIFPYLSAGEREMFILGMCPTCWDDFFKG